MHGCRDLISGEMERERVWIPEDGDFSAQTYAAILCTDCFDMHRRLEAMCQGHANTFAAELDLTLGARVRFRLVLNLAGGFGRGPPRVLCVCHHHDLAASGHPRHVSDSATDSGEDE